MARLGSGDRLLAAALTRPWSMLLVVVAALSVVAALWLPAALSGAVDAVLSGHSARITAQIGFLAAVAALSVLAGSLTELLSGYATASTTAWLRRRLLAQLLALGVAGQRQFSAGDLVSRLTGHAAAVGGATVAVTAVVGGLATSVGGVILLGLIDGKLAIVQFVCLVLGVLLIQAFVRDTSEDIARYQSVQSEMSTRLVDAVRGIRTIAASGTVEREVERVLTPLPALALHGRAWWTSLGRLAGRAVVAQAAAEVLVLAVAGLEVAAGGLSPGQFLAAAGYVLLIGTRFYETGYQLAALGRARAGAARAAEVLAIRPPSAGTRPLPSGPGDVTLREVTVRGDDGDVVLDGVSLRVPAGSVVVLAGQSGAGKSALAEVVAGLRAPDDGEALLDGAPIATLAPADLRRAVACAFERPALLGDTVAEAIAYGVDAGADDIRRAAAEAAVHDVLARLPSGYDTRLDELRLSGGEIQRIGLARALVRRPRLLVLDDATSSLDTATEARVTEALTTALPGHTRIVVSHRRATAARADLVVWLDDGRVRGLAPHFHLWADPSYREVFAHREEEVSLRTDPGCREPSALREVSAPGEAGE
ncbi:ABC transporter ATP-binding protein [Nonomuraea sp. NPDC003707]